MRRELVHRGTVRQALPVALVSWAAARAAVLGALALVEFVLGELTVTRDGVPFTATDGLLGYDAAWYRDIAEHGYGALPDEAVRFFPLVPLLARLLGFGVVEDVALVVIANASALVLGVLVYLLVVAEGREPAVARRAVWFVALFPAAFVFVWGYAEATAMALTVAAFLALRSRAWLWAAGLGFLVGLGRPTGFLLALPAAVEAYARWPEAHGPERVRRALAVAAAPAGTLVYLAVVGARYGAFFDPYSVQLDDDRSGGFVNPVSTLVDATRGLLDGDEIGTGLHVPWVAVLGVLAVLTFRYWPPSYGVFAVAALGAGVATNNLDSLERYGLAAFPILLTVAVLAARPYAERVVLVASASGLTAYATLAYLRLYVP